MTPTEAGCTVRDLTLYRGRLVNMFAAAFPPHKEPTLLVVDDDRSLLHLLSSVLSEEGVTTVTATTGEEALRYLARHSDPVVVLLDCLMPSMDGTEFVTFLRKNLPDVYERSDIYAFSSLDPLSDARNSIGPWVKGFIDKPDDLFELVDVIKRLVKREVSTLLPS